MSQYRDSFMLVEKEKGEESKHKGYNKFGFLDEERWREVLVNK